MHRDTTDIKVTAKSVAKALIKMKILASMRKDNNRKFASIDAFHRDRDSRRQFWRTVGKRLTDDDWREIFGTECYNSMLAKHID